MEFWNDEQHESWLRLASRMSDLVETLSGRGDIVVRIHPDLRDEGVRLASPLPIASFTPAKAEAFFNASVVLRQGIDNPDHIDPNSTQDQARHPELTGAAIHESAHAAHTSLAFPKGADPRAVRWAVLLEESRCEKRAIERRPQDAAMLRISTQNLVARGILQQSHDGDDSNADIMQAAYAALLLLARVDAGVLYDTDVTAVQARVEEAFGAEVLESLRSIWLRAQELEDGDLDSMVQCGHEIAEIIGSLSSPHDESGERDESGESTASNDSYSSSGSSAGSSSGSSAGAHSSNPPKTPGKPECQNEEEGAHNRENEDDEDSDATTPRGDGDTDKSDGSGSADTLDSGTGDGAERHDEAAQGSGGEAEDEGDMEAFRLPCGSWTDGDLPPDADTVTPVPGEPSELEQDAIRALGEAAAEARREVAAAAGILRTTRDPRQERAEERAQTAEASRRVFSLSSGTRSARIRIHEEAPRGDAQRMSRALSKAIKDAQYRDVTRTQVRSMTPPGRLNIREAAARDAQIVRRENITATPWSQTRRRIVDNPPLTVGIAVDVSGSMDRWQRPVSTFGWALAKAIQDLQGTVAMTAWNNVNTAIIHPGRRITNLPIIRCGGGSGGCGDALDALDGALRLSDSEGARVVVVVTDGHLSNVDKLQHSANRLMRYGVTLVWVITTPGGMPINGAVNIRMTDPREFSTTVARQITEALSNA